MSNIIAAKVIVPKHKMEIFDYIIPNNIGEINIGSLVQVNFRNKEVLGLVYDIDTSDFPESKLKKIEKLYDGIPLFSNEFVKFIKFVAEYNLTTVGSIFKMSLPPGDFSKSLEKIAPIKEVTAKKIALSESQLNAVTCLKKQINKQDFSVSLLKGVTGSGKTEVYFSLIADILENTDGQILILLPEIALTSQLIMRFEDRFGIKPIEWHSSTTDAMKRRNWLNIATGKARLVIGVRSAIFLPFNKLSLVVIDEEHESTYKQEDSVIYHARDMAVARAHYEKFAVILASATPSLETIANVRFGKYNMVELSSRFGEIDLPEVKVVDMRQKKEKKSYISKDLKDELALNLKEGKQSLLFLNRRGYAPLTLCSSCGYRYTCNNCSTWLVTHKSTGKLTCHHCGYNNQITADCPSCKAKDTLVHCGPGVERIAEEINIIFPEARICLMTRDTVSSIKQAEEVINSIVDKEVDIIVGTQMIAKGLHFPDLALVGVVDADLGLVGGDLRAAERTFQLLHQVGGRAGREKYKGKVILQSYYPDNDIIKALVNGNYEEFIDNEFTSRQDSLMPPFAKLAAIILSSINEDQTKKYAYELVRLAPIDDDIEVYGPAPATIYKMNGRYRYRILIKVNKNINIQKYIRAVLSKAKPLSSIRIKVDIDPYSFL